MIEIEGELWDHYQVQYEIICITTNGFVKKNGECVCGRGNALEATQQIPGFAKMLGDRIRQYGNLAGIMRTTPDEYGVFIFPVKHNWWDKASLNLILASTQVLYEIATGASDHTIYLPRPGCNNGRLDWESEVRPIVLMLPDNVKVITRKVKI